MLLGEKIKKTRMERGLTQKQLAGDCITRNMLSQIENGQATPSMKTLEHIAATLEVSVSWLLEQKGTSSYTAVKKLLREKKYAKAEEQLQKEEADNDEGLLLQAMVQAALARESFQKGEFTAAARRAQLAREHNEKTLYVSVALETEMLWILAHCAMSTELRYSGAVTRFRAKYDTLGWEAKNHLLQAEYYIRSQSWQAAEREIFTISVLPDSEKAYYSLLRGELALGQEKHSNAVSFLTQAEEQAKGNPTLLRRIYPLLETAYRELENFRMAYEYAAKRRDV